MLEFRLQQVWAWVLCQGFLSHPFKSQRHRENSDSPQKTCNIGEAVLVFLHATYRGAIHGEERFHREETKIRSQFPGPEYKGGHEADVWLCKATLPSIPERSREKQIVCSDFLTMSPSPSVPQAKAAEAHRSSNMIPHLIFKWEKKSIWSYSSSTVNTICEG